MSAADKSGAEIAAGKVDDGMPHTTIANYARTCCNCGELMREHMNPELRVFVPAKEVFPDLSVDFDTFRSLVAGLSRTDTMLWCARLNLLLSNPESLASALDVQGWVLARFFSADEIARVQAFAKSRGGADHVMVFTRAQMLELFRWAALLAHDLPNDGITFESPEVRRNFVKAALLAHDVWQGRTYAGGLTASDDHASDRMRSMSTFRRAVADNAAGLELQRGLARSHSIHDRPVANDESMLRTALKEHTKLEIEEYLHCVTVFMVDFCNVTLKNVDYHGGMFKLDSIASTLTPQGARAVERFLELESQTPDEVAVGLLHGGQIPPASDRFDDKSLRERPILRTSDGRAAIIDPRFFSEKLVVGPLFRVVKACGGDSAKVNRAFTEFGDGIERYVQSLFARMGSSPNQFWPNPRRLSANGTIELADGALRVGASLVVAETKGVFVPEEAVRPGDVQPYLVQLRNKYSQTTGRMKGVGQLARAVDLLLRDEYVQAPGDMDGVARLFPVLVVYDPLLSLPGHIEFLSREFSGAMKSGNGANGFIAHGRFLVAPLVVMTINNLEDLESSIQNFELGELLADYCSQGANGARPSLTDFMAAQQTRYRFIHSRQAASAALEELESAGRFMFAKLSS